MRNVQEDEIIKIKQQIRYLSLWMNSLDDEALANNSLLQRVLAAGEQIIEDTSDQMEAQHVFLTTDELLENFMDYLDCESLVSTHRVSKRFHRLSAHTVKRKGQSSLNDFQICAPKSRLEEFPASCRPSRFRNYCSQSKWSFRIVEMHPSMESTIALVLEAMVTVLPR